MVKALLPLTLFAFASPASAGEYRLDLKPTGDQTSRLDRGQETIISQQANTTVYVSEIPATTKPYAKFSILVRNRGESSFNFGPENGRLIYKSDGSFTAFREYRQVAAAEQGSGRKKQDASLASAVSGGAFSSALAGERQGTGTAQTAYTSADFTYSGNSPIVEQMAINQSTDLTLDRLISMQRQHVKNMNGLLGMVQTTTIDPGYSYGGLMMVSGPKSREKANEPHAVTVEIRIAGDVHRIEGTLQRR